MPDNSMTIAREYDHDRYLLSLFTPHKFRPAIWVVLAFNYEISKTWEVVSDHTIGLIRLQWWRDALDEIYAGKAPRKHEVVEPLAEAIRAYDLPQDLFERLIAAREFDLQGTAPETLECFYNYCNATNTPLTQLILKITGETATESQIKNISVHYSAVGLVRAVPYMLENRRIMIPTEILEKNNISKQKLFDFNQFDKLSQVVEEIISLDDQFRNGLANVNSRYLKAKLAMTNIFMNHIRHAQFDIFDPRLRRDPPWFALRLWLKSF